MFDSAVDRLLSWRLGAVHECSGHRRFVRRGVRNGIWFLDTTSLDLGDVEESAEPQDLMAARARLLDVMRASGLFSAVEIDTIHALAVERLTLAEIATRDGCSRQAVVARLVGNSKGQGGAVRKAERLRQRTVAAESATSRRDP